MKLLIGAPIRDRAWILPTWLQYVRAACAEVGVESHFVFAHGASADTTAGLLRGISRCAVLNVREGEEETYLPHIWNDMERYEHMAEMRNQLLSYVRGFSPDYYLSLDTDILIAPGVLPNLLETIETCDAVGGKLYMDRSRFNPSWGNINDVNGGLQREDSEGVFRCDVIMAMKLMTPKAYDVDYVAHFQGEDVGWSLNCRYSRVKLKWDGRVASKHVMIPEMLTQPDTRVGY